MLSEFPTKHASNSPVTFVILKRFAVLFFLLSCCVNSLMLTARHPQVRNDQDDVRQRMPERTAWVEFLTFLL